MNKSLLVLFCTLASGVALAQAVAPAPGPDRSARRAEFQARAQARFADSDRNHDGRISLAEFQDASDRRLAERFHRMDADRDGQLTEDELRQAHQQRREHLRDGRQARAGRRHALLALDTNHDQALDRAELGNRFPKLAERFDQLDANHDGRLTRDEMRAGRDARRQQAR